MSRSWRVRISPEMLVRMVADMLLLNMALLSALAIRLFIVMLEDIPDISSSLLFWNYLAAYANSMGPLMAICLVTFYLSGFYTHGRAYRGRYKALIVAQAISLGYLLFGFLSYFLSGALVLPRGVLFLAWGLSIASLIGARLWAVVWAKIIHAEREQSESLAERNIKNVLVIGGAGYIGSALLPKLLDNGYHVRLLDLLLYGTEPIQNVLGHPRLELMQADFRQVDKVVEAMRGMNAVVHLGAIVGDPACALDEELTIEVNLMATRMIAEVAKGSGVNRFIFASTCSVYGASDLMLDEHSALNPVSLYARSKIASERVLMKMAVDRFGPVILRLGTIYGLSGRTRFDLVVNLLTAKAIVDHQITVLGGDQWRPFIHVDDAALAVLKALEAPLAVVGKQIFNVGSKEQNYTIQQVAEIIHQRVPTAQLINIGSDADPRNYKVNFSKIHQLLGFVPQWSVAQGVEQVSAAIKGGQVTDYRHAKYSNVEFLSREVTADLMRRENGWAHALLKETLSDFSEISL